MSHLRSHFYCNYYDYNQPPSLPSSVVINNSRFNEPGKGSNGSISSNVIPVDNRWSSEYIEIELDDDVSEPSSRKIIQGGKAHNWNDSGGVGSTDLDTFLTSSFYDTNSNDELRYLYNIESENLSQYEGIGGEYIIASREILNGTGVYSGVYGGDTFISKIAYNYGNVVTDIPYRRKAGDAEHSLSGGHKDTNSWGIDYLHTDSGTQNRSTPGALQGWDVRSISYFFVESNINTNYRSQAKDNEGNYDSKNNFFPNNGYVSVLNDTLPIGCIQSLLSE